LSDKEVVLAAVSGAHGIGGEVRLKLFAESVETLRAQKTVKAGERELTLLAVKGVSSKGVGTPIVRFAEVGDRNGAEALRGTLLSVPRSSLPPLEEGEYYHADLIGLPCEGPGGEPLGTVAAVENFGAGDILEIEKPDGRKAMVPFREGIADMEDGRIRVDPAFLA
jgi:16S rRNA processing protein RimM